MVEEIILRDRLFVPLRKQGGRREIGPVVFHAVTPNCRMALCGDEPGAKSGWAESVGATVTCPKCLKRLAALAEMSR